MNSLIYDNGKMDCKCYYCSRITHYNYITRITSYNKPIYSRHFMLFFTFVTYGVYDIN